MISNYRRIKKLRADGEIDGGFTLIELLIVIVVLGILAAVVVFSLGSVVGKSAVAACQSDAATLNTAIAASYANNSVYPASQAVLATTANGGPYIQTIPANSHYAFSYTGTASTYSLTVIGNGTGAAAAVVANGGTTTTQLGAAGACSLPATKIQ